MARPPTTPPRLRLLGVLGAAFVLSAACGTVAPIPDGSEGGPCHTDGTCDDGLLCTDEVCVQFFCTSAAECPQSAATCVAAACEGEACLLANVADGTTCLRAGTICHDGHCLAGCYIEGDFYGHGEYHPASPCLFCDSLQRTAAWTPDCESGQTCHEGACVEGCLVDGTLYQTGDGNPDNACQICDPVADPVDWTDDCDAGLLCRDGACVAGCRIGGTDYEPGDPNPANACEACDPDASTSAFSPAASGTSCDDGLYCTVTTQCDGAGACGGGAPRDCSGMNGTCVIGVCNEGAGACQGQQAPTGTPCGGGMICDANGQCIAVPPDCEPKTCADFQCGTHPDGCGGFTADCGGCGASPNFCDSNGVCQCTPLTCSDLGASCGSWPDGCGGMTASCGACQGESAVCDPAQKQCSCTPDTCSSLGVSCGSFDNGCSGTLSCPCTLTVQVTGSGSGTVSSNPAGINNCSSTCSAPFAFQSSVGLSHDASPGSEFVSWSGGGCSGTGGCTVTMTSNQTVSAQFDPLPTHTLEVFVSGLGTVTSSSGGISCRDPFIPQEEPSTCSATFTAGTQVILSAEPDPGESFQFWTADCNGTNTTCSLTMDGNRSAGGFFTCNMTDVLCPE